MRYLEPFIIKDLQKKMVLISGPRQCGKTTFAKSLEKKVKAITYLNYDSEIDRKRILKQDWDHETQLVILDEIHKYSRWKNFLKGIYDTQKSKQQILVTGSARLDIYRKGQDSMLGRYHGWRMHPFCLAENPLTESNQHMLLRLMERGGFPEPLLAPSVDEARRWKNTHLQLVLREDVRDLTLIREASLLELMLTALRERVGSPIVMANLARDIEVAPKTAKAWLNILQQLYLCIVVKPYARGIDRGLTVPPKVFFYNNAEVEGDIGARFENLVATHLLKRAEFLEDSTGYNYELRYIRDKEKREVDFLILRERKPFAIFECKWTEGPPSKALQYYSQKLKINRVFQLTGQLDRTYKKDDVTICPAARYLARPLSEEF